MIWLSICWRPFVWGYVRYIFCWRVFSLPELVSSTWPLTFDGHWSIWFILITTWDNTKGSLIDFLYEHPTRNKDSDSSRVGKSFFLNAIRRTWLTSPPYSSGNFQPPTDFTHPERHSCRWAVHITWKNNCKIRFLNSILPLKHCGMSLWPHENKSTFYFQNRFFKPTFVKHPWKTNTLLVQFAVHWHLSRWKKVWRRKQLKVSMPSWHTTSKPWLVTEFTPRRCWDDRDKSCVD